MSGTNALAYFAPLSVTKDKAFSKISNRIVASASQPSQPSQFVTVQTLSSLTHVFGWGIPAVLTIAAIVAHQVIKI
jgi:hypothetical protein